MQTFGDFLGFNPHCHILMTDGCFYGDGGMFRVAPPLELKKLEAIPCILEPQVDGKAFRKSWARLNQKIYEVDPLICPKTCPELVEGCQGSMRIISAIDDRQVIRAILEHPGLWRVRSRPPPKIHDPPIREYAAADHPLQTHADTIYGDPEYTWDEYIQS